MSLKGLDFSTIVPKAMPFEKRQAWIDENNERWRIIGQCEQCGRDLVAEEAVSHRVNHVPDHLRSYARDLVALPLETRRELLSYFTRDGRFKGAE